MRRTRVETEEEAHVWHCADIPHPVRKDRSLAAVLPGISRLYNDCPMKPPASGWASRAERLALIETSFGATTVTTLEAPDVDRALGQIIASEIPFDVWYRERLQKLHGINLAGYEQFARPTPVPDNQELLFEWTLNSSGRKNQKKGVHNGRNENGKDCRSVLPKT